MSVLNRLIEGTKPLFWVCTVSMVVLDLWSKAELFRPLEAGHEDIVLIPGFLHLVPHGGNTQGAFGMGPQSPAFFIVAAIIGLIVISLFVMHSSPRRWHMHLALGMLAGGALGNLYDRLKWGSVRDFIDCYYGDWHWPTFNVADIAICIGFGIAVLDSFIAPDPEKASAGDGRTVPEGTTD